MGCLRGMSLGRRHPFSPAPSIPAKLGSSSSSIIAPLNSLLVHQLVHTCRQPGSRATQQCLQVVSQRGGRGRGGVRRRPAPGAPPAESITEFGFKTNIEEVYKQGELIGEGGFGTVHKAIDKETGDSYALKRIPKLKDSTRLEPAFVERIRCEVDALNALAGSLNTAYLYDCFETDNDVILVFDMLSGGTLTSYVERLSAEGGLGETEVARIAKQMLKMIAQCHSVNIVHRDIKPDNFLYSSAEENAPLKAIDFGTAARWDPKRPTVDRVGTPIFMAPEVVKAAVQLRDPGYGPKVDVYSAGVVIYLLLMGRYPYCGAVGQLLNSSSISTTLRSSLNNLDTQDVFSAITTEHMDFESEAWMSLSADARSFVSSLLERNPEDRPTAVDALSHCFLVSFEEQPAEQPNRLRTEMLQRLQRYGTYHPLKRLALEKMVDVIDLPEDLLSELRDFYHEADANSDNELCFDEILDSCDSYHISRRELEQLLIQMDLNGDGRIQYTEFVAALFDWKKIRAMPQWDHWLAEVFSALGATETGSIEAEDMKGLLEQCCSERKKLPRPFKDAMRQIDTNHDGKVSFSEFTAMVDSVEMDLELFSSRFGESF